MQSGSDITLAGATLVVEGTGANSGTIDYADTTSTALLNHVSASANTNPTLTNFTKGDSIGISTQFNQMSVSTQGNNTATVTLSENGNVVARFSLTNSQINGDAFYPVVNTEVVGGVTYYVATLDPPASGSGGSTTTTTTSHGHGATTITTTATSFVAGAGAGLTGVGSLPPVTTSGANGGGNAHFNASLLGFASGAGGSSAFSTTDLVGGTGATGATGATLDSVTQGSNVMGGSVNLQNGQVQNPLVGFRGSHG
jgi:hypothetical protein